MVKLRTPIDNMDYLNASWISDNTTDVHENDGNIVTFIASQGPNSTTCAHHLQLIYENHIDIIVMLTKCREQGGKG